MENSYWNDNGKFQKQQEYLWERYVPKCGGCSDRNAEMFRLMCRLYYDVYNNGACNVEIGWDENDNPDMEIAGSSLRIIIEAVGDESHNELFDAVQELRWKRTKTRDDWDKIKPVLEHATDTVIEYAWNELQGYDINEFETETI